MPEALLPEDDVSGTRDSLSASGGVDVSKATPAWKGRMVGHFKLLSILGQGAMGKVFIAEDTILKRHVALKLLPAKFKDGRPNHRTERLIKEAHGAIVIQTRPGTGSTFTVCLPTQQPPAPGESN